MIFLLKIMIDNSSQNSPLQHKLVTRNDITTKTYWICIIYLLILFSFEIY